MGNKHTTNTGHDCNKCLQNVQYKLEAEPYAIFPWTKKHKNALKSILSRYKISSMGPIIASYIPNSREIIDENNNIIYYSYCIKKLATIPLCSHFAQHSNNIFQHFIVCGREGSGKSNFAIKLVADQFVQHYDSTIEDSYFKECKFDGNEVKIQIFDQARSEPPTWLWYDATKIKDWQNSLYYYDTNYFKIYFVMFSLDSRDSFVEALWLIYNLITYRIFAMKQETDIKSKKKYMNMCIVLLCNKCDLRKAEIVHIPRQTHSYWKFRYGMNDIDPNNGLEIASKLKIPYFELSNKDKEQKDILSIIQYSIKHYWFLTVYKKFNWKDVAQQCYDILGLGNNDSKDIIASSALQLK